MRQQVFTHAMRPIRAAAKTAIFFFKVFPLLPSRPLDWVTSLPVIERVRYPTRHGQAEGNLYRPKVFVRSLTALLEPGEAELLRNACTDQGGHLDSRDLSEDGRAVYPLLTALSVDEAEEALHRLPTAMQERLANMSPLNYLKDMHAPLMVFLHDRGDLVIPVGESRRLQFALSGRAGVHYTELLFQHLDPTKRRLPLFRLVQQLGKFFLAVYPVFRQAVAV